MTNMRCCPIPGGEWKDACICASGGVMVSHCSKRKQELHKAFLIQ